MGENQTDQSLTSKVVRGGAWIYGRGLVTSVINIGVMAILARQLTPADFGLVALASVLLRFLATIASDGVGAYVIHDNREEHEERAHAAFWMDLALSSTVTLLGVVAIPLIINFYSDQGLGWILAALLLRYPIDSMTAVPDALIKKSLDFQSIAIRDAALEITQSIGSVILALNGWGVWSLVLPGLILAPIRVIMVFWLAGWYPQLPLRTNLWREIFGFSASVVGSELANSLTAEGDTLIIGKTMDVQSLGLYNLAWQSANMIVRMISGVIGKMSMPALSAIKGEPDRLREGYNRMSRMLGITSFPLLMGLFVIADKFILSLYGPQWSASILPMQILIIFALTRAISSPISVIYSAVGRPEVFTWMNIGFTPIYLLSVLIGSRYGVVGVAIGVTAARTAFSLFQFWLGARIVGESLKDFLDQLKQPFFASLLMSIVVWTSQFIIDQFNLVAALSMACMIAIGGLVYWALASLCFPQITNDTLLVVKSFSPSTAKLFQPFLPKR